MIGKVTTTALTAVLLSIASVCAQETVQEGEMIQVEEMTQGMADESHLPKTLAGVQVSTLGLGVFAAWDVSNTFAVRGMVNYFGQDLDRHEAGIEYEVDLQLQSVGLILDWHAFRNSFRLSGGAFLNQNEFSGMAEGSDIEIGENEYSGVINALVDFDSVAPYLSLGWSSGRGRSGLSFGIEAGVLFQGTPKLSASGMVTEDGITCDFSVSEAGQATACPALGVLKVDLEAEHRELNDELESYQLYPVLSLSVSYRF